MKKLAFDFIALSALAAACHEQRQDPPLDTEGIRARAADSNRELPPPPPSDAH